jgi:hypothetical protein
MLKKIFIKRIDTRVLPRIRLDNFVRYKLDSDPSSNFYVASVKNISGSGILFVAKTAFLKGQLLNMTVNFPGLDPFDVKADIARIRRIETGEYEIGAHFIVIDAEMQKSLTERINYILKKIAEQKSLWKQIRKAVIGR